jgi:hypothetical protein
MTSQNEIRKQESDIVFLTLLTINHADLPSALRLVNNTVNVTSRGQEFQRFPYTIADPSQDSDQSVPRATIRAANVDRTLMLALRQINGGVPANVLVERISSMDFDFVEKSYEMLLIGASTRPGNMIDLELTLHDGQNEPFPGHTYNPSTFNFGFR